MLKSPFATFQQLCVPALGAAGQITLRSNIDGWSNVEELKYKKNIKYKYKKVVIM